MSEPNVNTKPTDIGINRTGIATSPIDAKAMVEGARAGTPNPTAEPQAFLLARTGFAREAPPVGTMPPPASLKGVAKTGLDMVKGKQPLVLLDLLGERLAFERTGTRLYESLLVKLDAADRHPGGPTRDELERIRDDELSHFALLKQAIESLGGDPTVMTPSADTIAIASSGIVKILSDPRITMTAALKGILTAELVDNDSWTVLAEIAEGMGHDALAAGFRRALATEEDHLARVRAWTMAALTGQAGVRDVPAPEVHPGHA